MSYWHCSHSMLQGTYVMVRCPSVCLSVPSIDRCSSVRRFAAVGPASRYQSTAARRRSAATASSVTLSADVGSYAILVCWSWWVTSVGFQAASKLTVVALTWIDGRDLAACTCLIILILFSMSIVFSTVYADMSLSYCIHHSILAHSTADSQPVNWLDLTVGGQQALSLHSSIEPGELSQWLWSWWQHHKHCRGYCYYFYYYYDTIRHVRLTADW